MTNSPAPKRSSRRRPAAARSPEQFQFAATIAFLELEIASGDPTRSQAALDELRRRGWDVRRLPPVAAEADTVATARTLTGGTP